MALILSLREGDDFYVGDSRILLTKIAGPRQFTVETPDGSHWGIVDDRMTEVMPDVLVSSGTQGTSTQVRVVIEAPREIRILRGAKYREGRDG